MHDKDATPIEAIDFKSLQEPIGKKKESPHALNSKFIIWFAFIFLLLCALIVFLFLPKYVANKQSHSITENNISTDTTIAPEEIEESPKPGPKPQVVEPLSKKELSALKQEAEQLLLQVIEKQELLDNKAVKKWAEEEFRVAVELGTKADEHLRKKEYTLAIESYNGAIKALSELEETIAPTLEKHLNLGEKALKQAEKTIAIHHFELANAIDKSNTQAKNGLQRATTIEALYALLEKGGKLEAANRFNDAKASYQEATKLDPLSIEAEHALSRINARLSQIELTRLINQGNASLKQRQYNDARSAYNAALKLSPNSTHAKQGLVNIRQAERNEKLSALKAEALHFENSEDWPNAITSYQEILAIAPNSESAQAGLLRNQQRGAVLASLNEHINNKLRLSTPTVAAEAKQLLNQVAKLNKPGEKIQQAAASLNELLFLANQPIQITLESDNQTDIAIYKIGKLGKFSHREIDLKPGKYTIVGSRTGFRDVRKVITVLADMQDKTIRVRCEEPI